MVIIEIGMHRFALHKTEGIPIWVQASTYDRKRYQVWIYYPPFIGHF